MEDCKYRLKDYPTGWCQRDNGILINSNGECASYEKVKSNIDTDQ
jgi:hypothetical protein